MKKILIAMLACGAILAGTTACGETDMASSVVNSTADMTSSTVSEITNTEYAKPENIATADDAQNALQIGNKAFQDGKLSITTTETDRTNLSENGQKPYATVITCSDSRVPPELIFNSSLGEIFTVRTAGNVVADFETGSVEYGVDHLGTPLVVVMGHTKCGAVAGAIEGHAEGHVKDIIKDISPSVEKAKQNAKSNGQIATLSETYNVQNSIENLRKSEILSKAEQDGKIKIVGALYDITTGEVRFL